MKSHERFCLYATIVSGTYLVLAQSGEPAEIAVACFSGIFATAMLFHVSRILALNFQMRLRWLKFLPRLPVTAVTDTMRVLGTMIGRQKSGNAGPRFKTVVLDHRQRNARSPGWRALHVIVTSLPPNTFVVNVSPPKNQMTIHELVPKVH
jgi:hypothetical protein